MRWKDSEFWKNSSPSEIISFFEQLPNGRKLAAWVKHMEGDLAFADLVFEYLWICRSDEKVIDFLNRNEISPKLILHFIYFGFGKQLSNGNTDSVAYFLEIKSMLTSEQSLRLLSLSVEMDQDPTLKIHLLSNLDPRTWEAYFDLIEENSQTMAMLLEIFSNLREKEIRKILLNSPTLYYYLRMMVFFSFDRADKSQFESDGIKEYLGLSAHLGKFLHQNKSRFRYGQRADAFSARTQFQSIVAYTS